MNSLMSYRLTTVLLGALWAACFVLGLGTGATVLFILASLFEVMLAMFGIRRRRYQKSIA